MLESSSEVWWDWIKDTTWDRFYMLLTFAQVDHLPSLRLQIPSRQYGSPGSVDTSYAGPSLWISSKEKRF